MQNAEKCLTNPRSSDDDDGDSDAEYLRYIDSKLEALNSMETKLRSRERSPSTSSKVLVSDSDGEVNEGRHVVIKTKRRKLRSKDRFIDKKLDRSHSFDSDSLESNNSLKVSNTSSRKLDVVKFPTDEQITTAHYRRRVSAESSQEQTRCTKITIQQDVFNTSTADADEVSRYPSICVMYFVFLLHNL